MSKDTQTISRAHLAAGRAVDHLRRQLGIVFEEENSTLIGACPTEGLTQGLLASLVEQKTPLSLLITGARARQLGWQTGDAPVVRIDAAGLTLAEMVALADPLAAPANLPAPALLPVTSSHETLMTLVKYATLLPALLVAESSQLPADWLRVSASDVAAYWAAPPLDMVKLAEAALPVAGAEDTRIVCFRERYGTSMHLALIVGEPQKREAPLTRIHSSCITGDILGSLRCDCGGQLKLAVGQIAAEGSGVLLYLHQEGRGIGIANKLRAYALQERGLDTYEANLMLGFSEDERDFALAAAVLKKLGIARVRLLTNNPHKLKNLESHGISVEARVPLITEPGAHNQAYLAAKAGKSGHLF